MSLTFWFVLRLYALVDRISQVWDAVELWSTRFWDGKVVYRIGSQRQLYSKFKGSS
jgi:hypothetical protein